MQPSSLLLVILASGAVSQLQQGPGCQALPKEVKLGPGIPMRAQDIPTGCADFEVLVGPYIACNSGLSSD